MTLEDEIGVANTILWIRIFEAFRPVVLGARLISVTGKLQRASNVIHVVAEEIEDLTPLLRRLSEDSACIDAPVSPDEGKRPVIGRHRHPRSGDALVTLFKDKLAGEFGLDDRPDMVMPKGRNFH